MTEDEYWNSDPNFNGDDGDEIEYEFLIDEPEDIDVLILPKHKFDPNDIVDEHIKTIIKCKNIESLRASLLRMIGDVRVRLMLERDYYEMQDMAKSLELNIQMLKSSGIQTD